MDKYLKSFVIGSSFPVFSLWFLRYQTIKKKKWTYESATIINPLYFGLMNTLSVYLAEKYKWNLRKRFVIISILSTLFLVILTTTFNFYSFTEISQYFKYYLRIFISHFITYNVIIYHLTKYIE